MKAQRSSLDRISVVPQHIIENILCLVPILDAVRTSILSRSWRYTWTRIPKLMLTECQFDQVFTDANQLSALEQTFGVPSQRKSMTKRCKKFYGIYQVLLLHHGPIHEFSLSMNDVDETCVELDQIILHLSRSNNNTLKNFTLFLSNSRAYTLGYRLPSSFFSLNQLTHLSLRGCYIAYQPTTFKGFGSATTLYLENVHTSRNTLLHFVSRCPLIKRFTLLVDDDYYIIGDDDDDDANITKLLDCLHLIEHLCISDLAIECFDEDIGVAKELPTALVHLKFLCFADLSSIDNYYGLPFVIRNSPNLEKLRLKMIEDPSPLKDEIEPLNLQDYSDIWLEHLKELEIKYFVHLERELEVVKLILAKSPVLKKVSIFFFDKAVTKDEEIMVLRILLCSPRASPHVQIFVERLQFPDE